jgi:hypothetical protein
MYLSFFTHNLTDYLVVFALIQDYANKCEPPQSAKI